MKRMKKLLAVMMAAIMVMAMGIVNVSAADNTEYTITINNATKNYGYTAYQIFKGDLSGSTLSNVEFGSALSADDQAALLTAYSSVLSTGGYESSAAGLAAALADKKIDAADFAEKLAAYNMTSAGTSSYVAADTNYTITVTGAGYYLVVNTTVPEGYTAYSDYILEVVKSTSVDPKSSVPEVEKKVEEVNDSTDDDAVWQDAADYDIDDSINYKLTGTMPNTLSDYSTYSYVFTDTLSAGLTVDMAGASIAVSDVTVKVYANKAAAEADTDGTVVTSGYSVSLDNVTGVADTDAYYGGTILTITMQDALSLYNGDNKITVDANSVIVVYYSATLNDDANIGSTGNPNEVILKYSNNPNGTGTGVTPKDLVTVFTFNLEVNKVDEDKKALEGAEFTLSKYNAEQDTYVTVKTISTGSTFTFEGLDSGKYRISETKTPDGYNSVSDIEFEIEATYDKSSDDPNVTGLSVTGTSATFDVEDTNYTKVSTTVVNKSGSVLPSTGGIGTTIFYIVGAILVLGAGVILVTRRRATSR